MSEEKPKKDLFIKSPFGPSVARLKQDGTVTVGQFVQQKEGEPIQGEVVHLTETPQSPLVYEGETAFDPAGHGGAGSLRGSGPAKVTSPEYRESWDRVFGAEESLPN